MSDLARALTLHQQGRIAEAIRVYEDLLRRDPGHASALHLLGVAHHQRGEHELAVELISRAIALDPAAASFHCNLGEAHRALKNLGAASQCYQTALSLKPDYPKARNNLGVVLFSQRRWKEAEEHFREASRLQPREARYHGHLGDALREQGRIRAAIACYEEALSLDPDAAHALCNLGPLLLLRGELVKAVQCCRRATELQPDSTEAFISLGKCLRDLGRFEDAMSAFERALDLDSHSAVLCANIGQAWQEMGDLPESLGWYERSLQLDPSLLYARCGQADAIREMDNPEEAITRYRWILEEHPACVGALIGLGQALWDCGEVGEAVECFEGASWLRPELAGIHAQLGQVLASAGNLESAVASYREALKRNPRCVPAFAGLATTLRGQLPDEDTTRVECLLADPLLSRGRQAALQFGLAQVEDARGDYRRAGEHMVRANALQRAHWSERNKEYDPQEHTRYVDRLLELFTPEYFARVTGFGLGTQRPVFVVGMPRSGTTLTEQILASHPQVFGAGERRFAFTGLRRLPALVRRSTPANSALELLESLDGISPNIVLQLATWHLGRLNELDGGVAPRIVDKMPDNYLLTGYLLTLFPRARIIHCRRNVRDVALSCWITNFAQILWSVDLEHIARRIEQYLRLMEHWRRVLPGRILEVEYERMVADQEGVSRQLIEWLGLQWDPACLKFHQTERLVRTASVTQVRQPIYRGSVERWRHYETMLAPLLKYLRDRGPATDDPAHRLP